MTDAEQIRELIREELEEHDKRHVFARREPTKITDPEGNEWITGALRKAEVVKFLWWALGAVASVVFAGLILFARVEIYPEVNERIQIHEEAAQRRMAEVSKNYATLSDVAKVDAALQVSRAERIQQFEAIKAQLDRIEERLNKGGR